MQCWGAQGSSVPAAGAGAQPESHLIPCLLLVARAAPVGEQGRGRGWGGGRGHATSQPTCPQDRVEANLPRLTCLSPGHGNVAPTPGGHVYPLAAASSSIAHHACEDTCGAFKPLRMRVWVHAGAVSFRTWHALLKSPRQLRARCWLCSHGLCSRWPPCPGCALMSLSHLSFRPAVFPTMIFTLSSGLHPKLGPGWFPGATKCAPTCWCGWDRLPPPLALPSPPLPASQPTPRPPSSLTVSLIFISLHRIP